MNGRHQAYGLDMRWHYVDPPNKLFQHVLKSPQYGPPTPARWSTR